MNENTRREPNGRELAILNQLLSTEFPGVQQLRAQIRGLTVSEIDGEDSVKLHVKNEVIAPVVCIDPVEASYSDRGTTDPSYHEIHILLHVQGGLLDELEFYTIDNSLITNWPNPEDLHIMINKAWPKVT